MFGQNFVVIGQKILISTGESKSFGTHITGKSPRHLVCIVIWLGMARNGLKNANIWPKVTKNANFGPNLAVYAKNPYYYGRKQKFWYQRKGKTTYTPCSHRLLVSHGTKWAKNANIWPKKPVLGQILPFLGQKS